MSALTEHIRAAQVAAGEAAVVRDLEEKGLVVPQPEPFTHTPRPAFVPQDPEHAWQRTFGDDSYGAVVGMRLAAGGAFRVLRFAENDKACVGVEFGCHASVRLYADPIELREMARRLIDAAYDIDAHPSASLAAATGAAA